MKYTEFEVVLSEIPDEITLAINISNCPYHCEGCHSPHLWRDIGTIVTPQELIKLINVNKGITCVGFMGGLPEEVNMLAQYINVKYENIKVGWYTGYSSIPININTKWFDYIKIGPYIKELGGLDNPNTNQRMYLNWYDSEDDVVHSLNITYKFWKHGNRG